MDEHRTSSGFRIYFVELSGELWRWYTSTRDMHGWRWNERDFADERVPIFTGPDAGRGALCQRHSTRQRLDGDANLVDTVY